MRSRDVADGQQVEIPVPHGNRTVGTQGESMSREWKDRYKRRRSADGKSAAQSKSVMWSEVRVAKHADPLSRKAAIVFHAPVP